MRYGSSTFGEYYSIELDASKNNALLIPEGFAHGFQTMTADVEILYIHSASYEPSSEFGINALDPNLKKDWPENSTEISHRDLKFYETSKLEGIKI